MYSKLLYCSKKVSVAALLLFIGIKFSHFSISNFREQVAWVLQSDGTGKFTHALF